VAGPDDELIRDLRRGDEAAFTALVERHHAGMVRFAAAYVHDQAVAEEVTQEAWLGVLRGIGRFEGRSSLRTWIFGIVANQARSRTKREGRTIPLSSFADPDPAAPAVEPDRFLPADDPRWPRWWDEYPRSWDGIPEERCLARETRATVERAIEELPPGQRLVISLRDVEGWTAAEACSVLSISETNQRVLLHRARSRVRRALESYFDEEPK
jgi:RNA polymerase sigma-70 factor (ECF subfamily)